MNYGDIVKQVNSIQTTDRVAMIHALVGGTEIVGAFAGFKVDSRKGTTIMLSSPGRDQPEEVAVGPDQVMRVDDQPRRVARQPDCTGYRSLGVADRRRQQRSTWRGAQELRTAP